MPFPSFSFCPINVWHVDAFKDCGISKNDYADSGQWVGKSNDPNCSNPKILYERVSSKLEDMNIEYIKIRQNILETLLTCFSDFH